MNNSFDIGSRVGYIRIWYGVRDRVGVCGVYGCVWDRVGVCGRGSVVFGTGECVLE